MSCGHVPYRRWANSVTHNVVRVRESGGKGVGHPFHFAHVKKFSHYIFRSPESLSVGVVAVHAGIWSEWSEWSECCVDETRIRERGFYIEWESGEKRAGEKRAGEGVADKKVRRPSAERERKKLERPR